MVLQKPIHPLQVTVQCDLWSEDIIGQYFFENKDGITTKVNEDTSRITGYVMLEDMYLSTETSTVPGGQIGPLYKDIFLSTETVQRRSH